MSNHCIKTGADVWLPEYECLIHGDLFEVGDCYILACGDNWTKCCNFDERGPYNVEFRAFVNCGSRTLVARKEDCNDFSYEGWEAL